MASKTYRERYDEIYRKYPEELMRIKDEISNEINYEFIEPYYIKSDDCNCIDYGKIISKVKWPDEKMNVKLKQAVLDENNYENPVPFLIAGTVIQTEQKEDGRYIVYLSDDEGLWNNPDDYDQLLFIKSVLSVKHCIVAHDMFGEEEYSIGKIENIRPGTRVMVTAFFLEASKNENWLLSSFSDIKTCSADISRNRRYYGVYLNSDLRMISREEYYREFFAWAEHSNVIPSSLKWGSQDDSNEMPSSLKGSSQDDSNEGCYIATCVYGSYDCPQVWALRRYRDYILYKSWYGRAFIYIYYGISPKLVRIFGNSLWFKKIWRRKLDNIVSCLQEKGIDSTPYRDKKF